MKLIVYGKTAMVDFENQTIEIDGLVADVTFDGGWAYAQYDGADAASVQASGLVAYNLLAYELARGMS